MGKGSGTASAAGFTGDIFTVLAPQTVSTGTHTGAESWAKVGWDDPQSQVDIGYHHNRIDRYVQGMTTFSGSSAWLTIQPGVKVAIVGSYIPLTIWTSAKFTCVGDAPTADYNLITDRRSASMLIESPRFNSWLLVFV